MRFSTTFLSGLILASLSVLEAREPTEIEQFYLELVNRARANPGAEVTRLAGFPWGDDGSPATADLNEGLSPGTITNSTKQPLAFDPFLIDAASDYSDFLLASEKFGHNENGTSRSRIEAAGYPIGPGSGWGENLATTTSTGTHLVSQARAEQHHRNLFIDFDYPGRGHRKSILNGSYREIGIAIREDLDGQSLFPPPFGNDVLSTQNFAYSSGRIFLTGVIYYDGNSDSFFTPGESAGVLSLEVHNGLDVVVASGTSFSSGGYSINLNSLSPGSYTLVAIDGDGNRESRAFDWNGSNNVKVDIVDPSFTAPPVITPPASPVPFRPDGTIGPRENSQVGGGFLSATGAGQEVTRTARSRKWNTWHASIQNTGTTAGSALLTGTRKNRLFKVVYRQRTGGWENVTAAVTTAYTLPMGAGGSAAFQIRVKPESRALGKRKGYQFGLTMQSVGDPSLVDRVIGKLRNRTTRARR